ncbi:MMPL family transporter [Owenweeksia hongkongensis]|uniref:MMPL family transporter n=1 Tax=Owenweeksia hongkongensis TaxID=253245 RepID=UPI003A94BA37
MTEKIYLYLQKHKALALILAALLWGVFGFFASQISIQEDISKTFPKDSALQQYQDFYKKSPLASKIIVAIGGGTATDGSKYIEQGQLFLQNIDSSAFALIDTVEFEMGTSAVQSSLDYFYDYLPYFLTVEEADSILDTQNSDKVEGNVQNVLSKLTSPEGYALRKYLMRDPAGMYGKVIVKLAGFKEGGDFELKDKHLFTEDGKYVLLIVSPGFPASESKNNGVLIEHLKSASKSVNDAEVLFFGGPVIAAANADQIKDDTTFAGIAAVVLILALLFWYYRKWVVPLVFFLPPLFGITVALGAVYLIKGEISIVTIGAGSIVLGIALDYCFHTFTHIKHSSSVASSLREISWPLVLSCFTTVLAFLSLLFLKSEILGDFGLLASFSLIGTLFFVLFVLPLLVDSLNLKSKISTSEHWLDRVFASVKPRPVLILGLIAIITVVLSFFVNDVAFEDDLNKINYFPDELEQAEQAITNSETKEKTLYIVTEGESIQLAIDKNKKVSLVLDSLKNNGAANSVVSINHLFPTSAEAEQRAKNWNARLEQNDSLKTLYVTAGLEVGIKENGFQEFYDLLGRSYEGYQLPTELLQEAVFANFFLMDEDKVGVVNVVNTFPEHFEEIEKAIAKTEGLVVDKAAMATSLIDVVKDNFNLLLIITTSLVFITLLINYGRIELALLTFLPMVLSWFWILGLCGLFDIKFNFVNVLVTTFIFGLGDDFCIFVTDGLLSKFKLGINKLQSYRSSIILSTTTTIIGTGVLLFAKHPALSSIAALSVIGMLCISFISLTLQPLIFECTVQKRKEKRLQPLTFFIILTSIISFGYFALGCLLMTALVPVFFIFPVRTKWKKRVYNFIISKFAWSVIYIMMNVKKTRVNVNNEKFEKPGIIVANHQSFIDILATVMLRPGIVILTKDWVWRSPLFGWVVRYAGFPTAVNELDENEDHIKECLDKGYSVVIFPEGTRSIDGTMKRFHKGAFYMAEKYQVDIIPVLLHGFDYTIRKAGFILLSGHLTMKILPRIAPDDTSFGTGYRERAKLIGKYMRRELQAIVDEREDVDYHRDAVFANYIYKGPILEWYVRIKLMLEKNFRIFDENVPKQGTIVDLGCGYGYLSYMLHFTGKNRQIVGLDYDDDKIAVAENCYAMNEKMSFAVANLKTYKPKPADCYIIKDVLHYLPIPRQRELLEECCEALNVGGRILVRDGFAENTKHKQTELTEFFSTRLMGFNKTENELSFIDKSAMLEIAQKYEMSCEAIEQNTNTSNQTLILTKARNI